MFWDGISQTLLANMWFLQNRVKQVTAVTCIVCTVLNAVKHWHNIQGTHFQTQYLLLLKFVKHVG